MNRNSPSAGGFSISSSLVPASATIDDVPSAASGALTAVIFSVPLTGPAYVPLKPVALTGTCSRTAPVAAPTGVPGGRSRSWNVDVAARLPGPW